MRRSLPPTSAWPVRRTAVTEALGPLLDDVDVVWATWAAPSVDAVQASWDPDADVHRATLWVWPMARERADAVRGQAEASVLPAAAQWLGAAVRAGEGWQATRHERRWRVGGGEVRHLDRDGTQILQPRR